MAKRTTKTKSQTSNLVRKLGPSPSKPVASEQMKSTASGFQTKFNKINVSNFVTGGSSSTSPGANYGNQATVHSIAGKKVGTATQIPQLATPETIEAKGGGDSLISSLAKMFSFMQQTRDDDVKRRETEKSFAEEKKTEEQKRHEQFLKVLREYTSGGTTTPAAAPAADSGGGIMDFFKSMLDSALEAFSWVKDLFGIVKWVPRIISFLGALGTTGVLAILLPAALAAGLLTLLMLDKNPEATTAGILGSVNEGAVGTEIMKQQAENIAPEEIQKKNAVKKALLKDAPILTRLYDYNVREELEKKGLSKEESANLLDNTKPLKVPQQLKTADPELYNELTTYKLPEGIKPSTAGGGRGGMGGPTVAQLQADTVGGGRGTINPEMSTQSTPTAAPVPPTPATSSVNDLIAKNADLVMNESTSSGSGATQPIVSTSSNSTSSPDKAMSSSATQRDDTAIINRVFDRVRGGV